MTATGRLAALTSVAIVLLTTGCSQGHPVQPARPAAGSDATAVDSSAAVSSDGDGVGAASSVPASPDARAVALAFVEAWARPDRTQPDWVAGIRPYTSPTYLRLLALVDPSRVPAHQITGSLTVVVSTTAVLVCDVPTDALTVRVTINRLDRAWLVTGIAVRGQR